MTKHLFLSLLFSAAVFSLSAAPVKAADFSIWAEFFRLYQFNESYPELTELQGSNDGQAELRIDASDEGYFKPRPVQLRAESFVQLPAGIIIAVNGGYPLLFDDDSLEFIHPDRPLAQEYLDKSRGLTVGTVYAGETHAGFHLYHDSLFASDEDAEERHPVVIELSIGALKTFSLYYPVFDFAPDNPEWQPVELIRKKDSSLIAWKYSDDKKTRFRYIIHDENGNAVDEIDEGYFRDEYNLKPVDSGPFALRGFVQAVREGAAGNSLQQAGDIYIRKSFADTDSADLVFYSGGGSASQHPVELQGCPEDGSWYLLNGSEVFFCSSNIVSYKLPVLPDGFKYTNILVENSVMLLSWEESRFPFTGRSGLMLIKMRDILN